MTWDAGSVGGDRFHSSFRTTYLFTDPAAFLSTHRPDDTTWALVDAVPSLEAYAREPLLLPPAYSLDVTFDTPAEVEVGGSTFWMALQNPARRPVSAGINEGTEVSGGRACTVIERTVVICPVEAGAYTVHLHAAADEAAEDWHFVGAVRLQRSDVDGPLDATLSRPAAPGRTAHPPDR